MAVTARGRRKNSQDPERYRAYHGVHCELGIDNPTSRDLFLNECDLMYCEFKYQDRWFSCPGCVFDIDIHDQRQYNVRQATIAGDKQALLSLLRPELDLIAEALDGIPYTVYASGSKGLHVYAKNPDGWLSADTPQEFTSTATYSFVTARFSPEFVAIIDRSFYAHNKGIRPVTCPNPKTKVMPFELLAVGDSTACEEDSFLWWVCDHLHRTAFTRLRNARSAAVAVQDVMFDTAAALTARAPARPAPFAGQKEINEFSEQSLEDYVLAKSGHVLVKTMDGKSKKAYLIFGGDSDPTRRSWCPIYQSYHKTNCVSWVRFSNCSVASCFNDLCLGKSFVLRKPIPKPVTCPPESTVVAPENLTLLANDANQVYLPRDEMVESLQTRHRSVVLAPLGSGKTEMIKKRIGDMLTLNPESRVLIIATRRQQASGWMNFFGGLGFDHYELLKGCLQETPRLIVCLNSLLRILAAPTDTGFCGLKPYDLLVLDEVDSLARWLGGSLVENNLAIFETLKLVLKTAKDVVCMDGLPTEATGLMLKALGVFDTFHWTVFNRYRLREVMLVNNPAYFAKAFRSSLEEGMNIYFVSNSKRAVTRFKDFAINVCGLLSSEIMAIYGDMSQTDREISGNPDNWTKYRLLLANTSLGPGISFNPAGNNRHFSKVFCLAKPAYGISPEDMAQLIDRVRNPGRNQIIAMVLRTSFQQEKLDISAKDVLTTRNQRISRVANSVVSVLSPILQQRAQERFAEGEKKLRAHYAGRGKPLPPRQKALLNAAKNRQPLAVIPYFDEQTGELTGRPRTMTIGLVFHTPPFNEFCAEIDTLSLHYSADSEDFLDRLQEILHCQGSAISTVGCRSKIIDGKDVVLASHMRFLDRIADEAESCDELHLNNDDLLEKARSYVTPEQWKYMQSRIHHSKVPGADTSLYRLATVLNGYDGSVDCILDAMEKDVTRQFECAIDAQGWLQGNTIRLRSLPRGADVNNQPLRSELFECLNNVFIYLNHEWDEITRCPKSLTADNKYATMDWLQLDDIEKAKLWYETQKLCKLRIVENREFEYNGKLRVKTFLSSPVPPPYPEDHRLLFNILWTLLAWAGFPVIVQKDVRRRFEIAGQGMKKRTFHIMEFDQDFICLGKALLGRKPDGEKADSKECMENYFIWKTETWDKSHPPKVSGQ